MNWIMNNRFLRLMSFSVITLLAIGCLCGNAYTATKPSICSVSNYPVNTTTINIQVNEDTCNYVNTQSSYVNITFNNIGDGYDIIKGTYFGWCGDLQGHIGSEIQPQVIAYSSYDPSLPDHLKNNPWGKINYVLNHKQGTWLDVQAAIWTLIEGYYPGDFPYAGSPPNNSCQISVVPENVVAMVDAANLHGDGFFPLPGQVSAVILDPQTCDEASVCKPEPSIQLLITEVPCCTRSSVYWKTHSTRGPAPYDATWEIRLPNGCETEFFGTGKTWLEVLSTRPRGNPYFTLAHQYIAAYLNGHQSPHAKELLEQHTNNSLKKAKRSVRQDFVLMAIELKSFNEGEVGTVHCDN